MSKSIKKILAFLFILVTVVMLCSCVKAVTIKETTDTNDGNDTIEDGSIIIGVSKFTPGTVITGVRAATAGANDMLIYVSENGNSENYSYPKMYYYLLDEWFEYDETGKLNPIENISSLDIYYVNNVQKEEIDIPTKPEEKAKYTVFFVDSKTEINQKTIEDGAKVGELPTLSKPHYTGSWVDKQGNAVTADTVINGDTVFFANWVEEQKATMTLKVDGEVYKTISEYVGEKITEKILPPTKTGTNVTYTFTGWYTEGGEKYTIDKMPEGGITLNAGWDATVNLTVKDGAESIITKQSNEFVTKYYNMSGVSGEEITAVDDDIYYINLGEYTGTEETPTKLSINGKEYGTEAADLSIGNNNRIKVPVWKINDKGEVLVALTWLCAEALPTTETDVVISNQTIHVNLYESDVTGNVLTLESAGKFNTKTGYTHTVTLDKDTNTVTMKRGYGTMGLGITLKYDNDLITTDNNSNQVIFRMDTKDPMKMGLVTPENTEFTYAMYPSYTNKVLSEEKTRNYEYKLALPGKGVITVKMVCEDVIGTTAETGTLDELKAALVAGNDVVLTEDITTTEQLTIEAGKTAKIDLNGKTISNTSVTTGGLIENKGTLTLTGDGKIEAAGAHVILNSKGASLVVESGTYDAQGHQRAAIYNQGGEVTIEDGSFLRSQENGQTKLDSGNNSYYTIVNHGNMTIIDGDFSQDGHFSSMLENGYQNYNSGNSTTGYVEGVNLANPTLTIKGGNFSGGVNTIKNDDGGYIIIEDGTFTSYTQCALLNWNVAEIKGGTFDGTQGECTVYNAYGDDNIDKGKLTITGGTFKSPENGYVIDKFDGYSLGEIILKKNSYTIEGNLINSAYEDIITYID